MAAGKSPDYLANARDIAFVAGVYLYFAGWIYIYYYLNGFGIPVKAVDFDIYNLLIYSANVVLYSYNFAKLYLVMAVLLIAGLLYWKRMSKATVRFTPAIVILLFPVVFIAAWNAGRGDAENALIDSSSYLKRIEFILKDVSLSTDSSAAGKANAKNKKQFLFQNSKAMLRLVAMNADEYFVLQTGIKRTKETIGDFPPIVFVVKKDDVDFVKITK